MKSYKKLTCGLSAAFIAVTGVLFGTTYDAKAQDISVGNTSAGSVSLKMTTQEFASFIEGRLYKGTDNLRIAQSPDGKLIVTIRDNRKLVSCTIEDAPALSTSRPSCN